MSPLCSVEIERRGDACIVSLRGEIDLSNAAEVETRLASEARATTIFVLDLTELGYIDSSGFGLLERLMRQTDLRIAITDSAVAYRALKVTGLMQLLAIFDTVDAALEAS